MRASKANALLALLYVFRCETLGPQQAPPEYTKLLQRRRKINRDLANETSSPLFSLSLSLSIYIYISTC